MLDDPLLIHRSRFPIVESTNYLISNSLGAMPRDVEASLAEYASLWATRGVRAWEESWWTMAADLGDLVAPLIGAGKGQVVFQPNVTIAHEIVFSSFDFTNGRDTIVTNNLHFPSILYLIEQQQGQGAKVVVVPSEDGLVCDAERVIDAIDDRTAFVSLSHVAFRSSFVEDIEAIVRKAKRVGAMTIIDGYQAVGSIAVDVEKLGVDIYIGGCLKWLCGGPGAAFLWVRPEIRRCLEPRVTGWMAHERPFAFEPTLTRRNDAWRFLHGTPVIPALYAAQPGLRIINEIGIDAIRAKSIRQTTRLLELAEACGYSSGTPRESARRGGTVALNVGHAYEVSKTLKARDMLCDYRPGVGIRLSPHFYTKDEELDAAVHAIGEILRDGSWKTFEGTFVRVT